MAQVASGSAPLAPDTRDFLRVAMCAPVIEGYGLTETCGASFSAEPTVVSCQTSDYIFEVPVHLDPCSCCAVAILQTKQGMHKAWARSSMLLDVQQFQI